jgi:hypothetical protein
MLNRIVFAAILLLSISQAINIVSPQTSINDGDTIDVGTVGPGQTVSILIDPKVTTGGLHGIGGIFDMATVEDLPRGWTGQDSKLYQNPLMVTVTADPDAAEGNYTYRVKVIDENNGEKLGNITFNVKERITYDVMDFNVTPSYLEVGPGQPARFGITIYNKGSTSDVFQVSSTGAKRWEFKKPVFVPAESSKTIYYEIVGSEEQTVKAEIDVVSLASPKINASQNVTLFIKSDLLGDYRATNNGVLVFPIFEAPIYSLAGLLSNLFPK